MSRVLICTFWILPAVLWGQRQTGELRIRVVDATGAALNASGELTGLATAVRRTVSTASDGKATIAALPFGRYELKIGRQGFRSFARLIEIRSEVPVVMDAVLDIAPIESTVEVSVDQTLLNPDQTGAAQQIGRETLQHRNTTIPAREILSLVDAQPGWLLEANGVLHPRGSEYGVQYVVDGLPVLDNRSPVFAPMLDIEEFQSVVVRTGGYPAEYGRQLGGVIEVTTSRDERPGLHGKAIIEAGGYGTARIAATTQFVVNRNTIGVAGVGTRTDRYLDPPVEQNFTNHGSGAGATAFWQRSWSDAQRTRVLIRQSHTGFQVPNEQLQQAAGQRQDRTAGETGGQLSYTNVLSRRLLLDARGSVRDVRADLWSNPLATPITPAQQRGFREAYTTASLTLNRGAHDLKAGGEVLVRSVREQFSYGISAYRLNGVRIFDRDTPSTFSYADRRQGREQSAYIQDHIRLGSLTIDAGIRWDNYRFVVDESAVSPRIAAAWQIGRQNGLIIRASYDRAFQTPAIENLLLASSAEALALGDRSLSLPVRPSRGNFYEAGIAKGFFGRIRLDASFFRRTFTNFPDDSLLLNTGLSFPIAFASADIHGAEVKLDIPRWGRFSGFLSFTNMTGKGRLPIAGGLFIEDGATALLASEEAFPITQDQRNTARGQVRLQVHPRVWVSASAQYGSGLPVELDETVNLPFLKQQFGPDVLDRVSFDKGRVRPSFSADLTGGSDLWRRENKAVRAQITVLNVTDRLNVINFAGLFSGTAIAPGRWAAGRLSFEF